MSKGTAVDPIEAKYKNHLEVYLRDRRVTLFMFEYSYVGVRNAERPEHRRVRRNIIATFGLDREQYEADGWMGYGK